MDFFLKTSKIASMNFGGFIMIGTCGKIHTINIIVSLIFLKTSKIASMNFEGFIYD